MTLLPTSSSLSQSDIDASLRALEPDLDAMLLELKLFPSSFKVTWWMWTVWVVYSYSVCSLSLRQPRRADLLTQVFVVVALVYFGYIRRSMNRVVGE